MTPLTRVAERSVTTLEGLDDRAGWAEVMSACGASQCGFCTPGIIVRAAALDPARRADRAAVDRMLLAHLCRCTGWQPIREAIATGPCGRRARDVASARRRATLEGGVAQDVGASVATGAGGFADDSTPPGSLAAVLDPHGSWVVGNSFAEVRRQAGTVQGRRSTAALSWPVDVPDGEWVRTLQTTWVEPGYLEPDASWCEPGGEPASPLGNGGAFGGKQASEVSEAARRLADEHGRAVAARFTREDVVRRGPKRPPLAIAVDATGGGAIRIGHSGPEDPALAIEAARRGLAVGGLDAASWQIGAVDVDGPPTSVALRGAIVAELAAVASSLGPAPDHVSFESGARATAMIDASGLTLRIGAGDPLDEAVLRSYCTGAAHMALGMVRTEGIAVDEHSVPVDLTIRSFGILRAQDTPPIRIELEPGSADEEPVAVSGAVFAAVLAAAWRADGHPRRWPCL